MFAAAVDVLPNNNILNIISKARQEPYQQFVLEMFETAERIPFKYDDPEINYLYLNGVVDIERETATRHHVRFACSFVQKRLSSYFSTTLFRGMGCLYAPFESLEDTITDDSLHLPNLLRRYERYLKKNRGWLLKDVPRRTDLRVYEAVYHFNLYMYLARFLPSRRGQVVPEFPTGNGKIHLGSLGFAGVMSRYGGVRGVGHPAHPHIWEPPRQFPKNLHLIIRYAGKVYGLEVKSYQDAFEYREALGQAAQYGGQLGLNEITLAFFVEAIDAANREKYEAVYHDEETGVTVRPVFVATGS